MQLVNESKRIEYIDIAKAIGILCIVLDHAELINDASYYINAFHVQIFFFISGFLFNSSNISFADFLKKKSRSLLLPYFVFGIAHYLFWLYRSDTKAIEPLIAIVTGNTTALPIAGSLWFLTALFISEIIYFIIDKYSVNYVRAALIVIISLFGCISPEILPITARFAFAQGCVGVGLMELGRILHSSKDLFSRLFSLKWYIWICVAGITAVLIRSNDVVHMFISSYGNIALFWINSVLSILLVFKVSIWISKYSKSIPVRYLMDVGKNSIVYLCLNNITINISRRIILLCGLTEGSIIYGISLSVLLLVLLYLISKIITKTKLKVLIGQKV